MIPNHHSPLNHPDAPPGGFAVLALVCLGDWLLWDLAPGVSLAIFGAAVMGLARVSPRGWLVYVLCALPSIEMVQALSVFFWLGGMGLALVISRQAGVARLWALLMGLPATWGQSLAPRRPALGPLLRAWAFPLGGALVLVALLAQANPLIEQALSVEALADLPLRAAFWLGIVLLVLPFLSPLPEARSLPRLPGWGLTPAAVLRALAVFNLILAVQMLTEASALGGGLPPGMTHATYAHRGAYPLLATALLAGAFALAARPFLDENRWMRPLLILWLAQNIALTGSAAWRLAAYVEAWGLSYLRVDAAIWMGLVAAGLGLCLWQVWRGYSNPWMLKRAVGLGLAMLYACSFVNFAALIAAQNLTRPSPDFAYVCSLGPMASGAIAEGLGAAPWLYGRRGLSDLDASCTGAPRIDHWQEWGFRAWRVASKVAGHEDPSR